MDPSATAVVPPGDPTRGGLVVLEPGRAGEVLGGVDVVFPVLHGPFGEDGTVQGLLEMAGVPCVGAGVLASAAGMDKEFTKKLLAADGLPVGDLVVLRPETPTLTAAPRTARPAGVRQARPGRLVGGHHPGHGLGGERRRDRRGPRARPEGAGRGGDRGPRGGVPRAQLPDGTLRASLPAEIRIVGSAAFYDFDAKYLDDVCEFDIPAKLDDEVVERVQEAAVAAFRALDCQGLARVDFFVGGAVSRWSTRSTRCPGSRRSRCTRGCGRSPASTTDVAGDLDRHRARPGDRPPVAIGPIFFFHTGFFRCVSM